MLNPGDELSGYRIEGVLGRGGMGVVYEATQPVLNRRVALKVVSADFADDPAFRERFRREGIQQASLDHPHIVPVFEAGEADGLLFIAMRLIRGSSLRELQDGEQLSTDRIIVILGQVAEALDAAHAEGRVHRDVKPQNILVDQRGAAYLADFGLTKGRDDRTLTMSGRQVGTLDYISPEQIQGHEATSASDVYALAAVAYECFAHDVPYRKESDAALLFAHLQEAPAPLTDLGYPEALDEAIRNGMAKEPADRPASAVELVRQLRAALEQHVDDRQDRSARAPSPKRSAQTVADVRVFRPPVRQESAAPREHRRWPVALVCGAAILVAVFLGAVVGRTTKSSAAPLVQHRVSTGGYSVLVPATASVGRTTASHLTMPLVIDADGLRVTAGFGPSPAAATGWQGVAILDQLRAYAYSRGSSAMYEVPTTRGLLNIECSRRCDEIVGTLHLRGKTQAISVVAAIQFASAVGNAVKAFDSVRISGRRTLARARTTAAQAIAAQSIQKAARSAASVITRIPAPRALRRDRSHIGGALTAIAQAYGELRTATQNGSSSAYADATRSVANAEAAVEAALLSLRSYGLGPA